MRSMSMMILASLLVACGGDGGAGEGTKADATQVDTAGDGAGADAADVDTVDPADGADVKQDTTPAGPVISCSGDLACEGLPCLFGEDLVVGICAIPCAGDGDCPEETACAPDPKAPDVSYCFERFATLCQPCEVDSDCIAGVCADYGQEGLFCAPHCDGHEDCPETYHCDMEGACRANTGKCACNGYGVHRVTTTTCYRENSNGRCEGFRLCDGDALQPCSAPMPGFESCNRVDDNCDGQTDEGFCDDGNPCTEDVCDPDADGACSNPWEALDGVPCDADQDGCTVADACLSGACAPGGPADCSHLDGQCAVGACQTGGAEVFTCVKDLLPNGTTCEDGDLCTQGDACDTGVCAMGLPLQCDDDNVCTADSCDPDTGGCRFDPVDGACDDGDACTVGDVCAEGACQPGAPFACGDDEVCTSDVCVDQAGQATCVFDPAPGACDDGSLCTTEDHCEGGGCVGTPMVCDDGDPCTDDSCDPDDGCETIYNTAPCDDFDPCTEGDLCDGAGLCLGAPISLDLVCDEQDDDCDGATDENCLAWEALVAEGPGARAGATLVAGAGHVMLAFGEAGDGAELETVWRYDPTAGAWSESGAAPGGGRARAACAWLEESARLYCHGGRQGDAVLDALIAWDPVADTWATVDATGVALYGHAMVAWGGELWLYGGANASSVQNKLLRFDPAEGFMQIHAAAPAGRLGAALALHGDTLHVLGGQSGLEAGTEVASAWTRVMPDGDFVDASYTLPAPLSGPGAAIHDGVLYLLGGASPQPVSPLVQRLTLDSDAWDVGTDPGVPLGAEVEMVVLDGRVYAWMDQLLRFPLP